MIQHEPKPREVSADWERRQQNKIPDDSETRGLQWAKTNTEDNNMIRAT